MADSFDNAPRVRARDLGLPLGRFKPGRYNAITDVDGVKVGHSTIIRGKGPLKPSGLRYTIDWSHRAGRRVLKELPAGSVITEVNDEGSGAPLCKTESCTATECKSTCAAGQYTVALTDFLANGGDGMGIVKDAPRQVGPLIARDILIAFVKQHDPLTAALLGSTSAGGKRRISQNGGASVDHD